MLIVCLWLLLPGFSALLLHIFQACYSLRFFLLFIHVFRGSWGKRSFKIMGYGTQNPTIANPFCGVASLESSGSCSFWGTGLTPNLSTLCPPQWFASTFNCFSHLLHHGCLSKRICFAAFFLETFQMYQVLGSIFMSFVARFRLLAPH